MSPTTKLLESLERNASPESGARAASEPRGTGPAPREIEELKRDLVALVAEDRRHRFAQDEAREREQEELSRLRMNFERAASSWMECVRPRLQMLVDQLPAVGHIERSATDWKVTATFPPSPEFPVVASLSVEITPVDRYRAGRVAIEPLLIPMLEGHPRPSTREFVLGAGAAELAPFVDRGVLGFAGAYLQVRDPDSPYQRCRRAQQAEGFRLPEANGKPATSI